MPRLRTDLDEQNDKMTGQGEYRPESCFTEWSDVPRPESCYTAASYNVKESSTKASDSNPRSWIENKFIAIRLTRARLWTICVFLSLLYNDELMPKGEVSGLDKDWKKAWLSEVQTPMNNMIMSLERTTAADMSENSQTIFGDIKNTWKQDSEQLTKAIGETLRSKMESTPECPLRNRIMGVRIVRTMMLVLGELYGDLGQDFKIPAAFTGDNSLLMRDAVISQSTRRKNLSLTKDFKDNLTKMQEHMASRIYDLQSETPDLYVVQLGNKSVAGWCDVDYEEIDSNILVPFANECNSWDIARSH